MLLNRVLTLPATFGKGQSTFISSEQRAFININSSMLCAMFPCNNTKHQSSCTLCLHFCLSLNAKLQTQLHQEVHFYQPVEQSVSRLMGISFVKQLLKQFRINKGRKK